MTGPMRRSEPLPHLHVADRLRHALARHRLRRHRHRERAVAGEHAEQRAKRHELPRRRHERHRRLGEDEGDERSDHEHLAAVSIADASPERCADRRDRRRRPEHEAAPQRDLADVLHAELADVQRNERHHDREAGKSGEAGGGRDEDIAAALLLRERRGDGSAVARERRSRSIGIRSQSNRTDRNSRFVRTGSSPPALDTPGCCR